MFCYTGWMNKYPLYVYVIGAILVWTVLLGYVRFYYAAHFMGALALCAMFFVGMLAMYIAVHVYRWK